jgi:hypothetical protein
VGLPLPRIGVVFRLWQCDKNNQDWREGPPLTVLCQSSDLPDRPSPSGKFSFRRKKNTATCCRPPALTNDIGRYKSVIRPERRKPCECIFVVAGAKRISRQEPVTTASGALDRRVSELPVTPTDHYATEIV